ncbi:hypothetical protein COLO4_12945 [Corchorus olitorius]|uniref:SPX domain-containing protein n=1 Tax=Corchorus olitorius TaxID=93759 RepID=A0A1R3JZ35_9ROSI|nr:hypothetical protein COLO4_12945 [Corchorus olitorius]
MHHGKKHRAEVAKSLPEWERMFIAYKELKKQVKLIRAGIDQGNLEAEDMGFTLLLDRELNKINTFYIDKEEDYIIRFRELEIMAQNLNGREEMLEVLKDILSFHAEMVMLLHYSVINFTGLMKIVKKHKKHRGASDESPPYMPRVLQQPFFSTDLLYNLIKGCEAILIRLSPPNDP